MTIGLQRDGEDDDDEEEKKPRLGRYPMGPTKTLQETQWTQVVTLRLELLSSIHQFV